MIINPEYTLIALPLDRQWVTLLLYYTLITFTITGSSRLPFLETDKALTSQEDRFNKGSYLNRQEFIQCLVRCAIAVYVKVREDSNAFERLRSPLIALLSLSTSL